MESLIIILLLLSLSQLTSSHWQVPGRLREALSAGCVCAREVRFPGKGESNECKVTLFLPKAMQQVPHFKPQPSPLSSGKCQPCSVEHPGQLWQGQCLGVACGLPSSGCVTSFQAQATQQIATAEACKRRSFPLQ